MTLDTSVSAELRNGLPYALQAQKLLKLPVRDRSRSFNMKGAVMDMMWLFATVMGVLLLGGIIVYKKSA